MDLSCAGSWQLKEAVGHVVVGEQLGQRGRLFPRNA